MSRARHLSVTAALLAVLLVIASGCSGSGSSDDSEGSPDRSDAFSEQGGSTSAEAPVPGEAQRRSLSSSAFAASGGGTAVGTADAVRLAPPERQEIDTRNLIKTGNVALQSEDVGAARFEVQKVVDAYAGEITEEETATDEEGEVERSRLVVRIPVTDFYEAMSGLEGAADLQTSSTSVDDVTTKVLDVGIRVRVQRRSIERIVQLLDRATTIRAVIAIEGQLAQRQADLASLERQQRFLAGQTQRATITVSLQRTPEPRVEQREAEEAKGFAAGLDAGWGQFKDMAVGVATASGALLPFVVALLVLGVPGVPLLRRLRRRDAGPDPVEA